VMVEMGQVSILKDGYQVPLCADSTVNVKSVIVTGPDGYAKLQTEDGSTFEVYPLGRYTFRENYPSFTDYVQVWMGKIRVVIDHHLGPNHNRVSTPTAVISVRGTVFDVSNEDQENTTLVEVEEGEVNVRHQLIPGEKNLHTGESVRVYADAPIAKAADHGNALKVAMDALRRAAQDALYTHPGGIGGGGGGVGLPGGASTSTQTSGDCRSATGCGTKGGTNGGSTGTPGKPPAPGTPPAPGGGGG